eukprot:SAG11_NODE_26979_length_338_cov_1.485356_1_plen_112_part_11
MCKMPVIPCPKEFPYATKAGPPFESNICYKTAAEAEKGESPCGGWCTMDVDIGGGCGDNKNRICAEPSGVPSSCRPSPNISACQARCDMEVGCSAINYNASYGCCLETCSAT